MKRQRIIYMIIILLLSIILSGCTTGMNNDETKCCNIIKSILFSSYDSFGDYQKLPNAIQQSVTKALYDCFLYREQNHGDYGELGKDYYEENSVYDIFGYTDENYIFVTYKYNYQCLSAVDNHVLRSSICIPVKVKLRKINGIYTVIDYFEKP